MIAGATRTSPGAVTLSLLATLAACQPQSVPSTDIEARALLQTAIEAHGGGEALARFDDFRIASTVRFKDRATLIRTVDYRDRNHWSMAVATEQGSGFRVGVDGERCWKQDRHRVETCADGEQRQMELMAIDHNAWVLHHLDASSVRPAEPVRVGWRHYPAIRAGDLVLVFDPDSHLLAQIHHGQRVEALSDYQPVAGVVIATRRSVFLAGEPDLEETWTEILPGGSDSDALRAPARPADGVVVDDIDPERLVAWTELNDPIGDAKAAVAQLDEFIHRQRRLPSGSEGIVWTAPEERGGRWRLAVGVEIGEPLRAVEERGLHLEQWAATRVLGMFHSGDFHAAVAQRPALMELMQERGLAPAPAARLQILAARSVLDEDSADSMYLVRIAVRDADEAKRRDASVASAAIRR